MMRFRSTTVVAAAVGAAALAAAAGCSQGGNASSAASTNQPPGAVVAAAYQKTVNGTSANVSVDARITAQRNGQQQTVPVHADGAIDFVHKAAQLTAQLPKSAGTMQIRYLNGMLYAKLPPQAATQLTGGKPWIAVNVNALTQQKLGASLQQLQSSAPSDPSAMLGYLRGTGQQVQDLGADTVNGVQTEHYGATIDLDKVSATKPASERQAIQQLEQQIGTHSLPAQLWIDHQGRLVKLAVSETMQHVPGQSGQQAMPITEQITETLTDYGTPVTVSAPPADQTTDITNQAMNQPTSH